jgi:hypothetical protein
MSKTKKKVSFWLQIFITIASAFGASGAVILAGQGIVEVLNSENASPSPTPVEDFEGEL